MRDNGRSGGTGAVFVPPPGNALALAGIYAGLDLEGEGPPDSPWGAAPSVEAFRRALAEGAPGLPERYQRDYVTAVGDSLDRLHEMTGRGPGDDPAETVLGAIYQHAPGSRVAAPLRRLLGLVSEVYAAFLGAERRARLDLPLTETVPPLATFRSDGSLGPYTFPSDMMRDLAGTEIGVVSLPSTYRLHPLLWGSLAHEVGGHDILHADPGLLDELRDGVRSLFGDRDERFLGDLWGYWIDEASADVYGILNLGPQFGLNLLAWLAALRARWGQAGDPRLLASSGPQAGGVLDPHPTDCLRVHLAIGAVASLHRLSVPVRLAYMSMLHGFGQRVAPEPAVVLEGDLPSGEGDSKTAVSKVIPRPEMELAAFRVGQHIATVAVHALGGCCIQAIETWSEDDERAARRIATWMWNPSDDAPRPGDTSHALAGATLAAVADPRRYEEVNGRLTEALDSALVGHPEWAPMAPTGRTATTA